MAALAKLVTGMVLDGEAGEPLSADKASAQVRKELQALIFHLRGLSVADATTLLECWGARSAPLT